MFVFVVLVVMRHSYFGDFFRGKESFVIDAKVSRERYIMMRRQTSGDFYDADAEPENDNSNNNRNVNDNKMRTFAMDDDDDDNAFYFDDGEEQNRHRRPEVMMMTTTTGNNTPFKIEEEEDHREQTKNNAQQQRVLGTTAAAEKRFVALKPSKRSGRIIDKKMSKKRTAGVGLRSHARLGVSPVRGGGGGGGGGTTTTTNATTTTAALLLSRKKEKKKRSMQQRRERTSKRERYSLGGAAASSDGGGTDDEENGRRVIGGVYSTAMEREDAKRRQMLYKRLDRLKQLPSQSQFAKTQIALVNKCLEMLMKVTVRTNEEEDELAKLLSSVKI